MKIFLISGKAGSGKSEVARLLKEELESAVITNFSKYIKLFALEMTNWNGLEETKPRTFLQEMGDTLRKIDKNFLVHRMLEDVKVYETKYKYVIINDVRLVHEVEEMKKSNYPIVFIRVDTDTYQRNLTSVEKLHCTEVELDSYPNFDYRIRNHFDATLIEDVKKIVEGEK